MRRLLLVPTLVISLGASLLGCKHRRTDHLPGEQLTTEELLREREALERGEKVGEQLRKPSLVATSQGVSVNGVPVASSAEIDDTKIAPVPKLRLYLRGVREHGKRLAPSEPWAGTVDLEGDPGTTMFALANVMNAALFAGYPQVRVKIPGLTWDVRMFALGPPRDDDAEPPQSLLVVRSTSGEGEAELRTQGRCPRPPNVLTALPSLAELPGVIVRQCTERAPCHVAVAPSNELVANVLPRLSPSFAAGAGVIDLVWGTELPTIASVLAQAGVPSPAAPPPSPTGSERAPLRAPPARAATLANVPRLGAIETAGPLSIERVRAEVEAHRDELRACYLPALADNPTLTGRVTAKLAVDLRGAVGEVCSSSDLPDRRTVQCVEGVLARLSFLPAPGAVVHVQVPMMFSAPP